MRAYSRGKQNIQRKSHIGILTFTSFLQTCTISHIWYLEENVDCILY